MSHRLYLSRLVTVGLMLLVMAGTVPDRRTVASLMSQQPAINCAAAPSCPHASPLIIAPSDNLVVTAKVPVAVTTPGSATSVIVLVAYRDTNRQMQQEQIATLDATDGWAATWDFSDPARYPSQSGVTLSFWTVQDGQQALIGQRQLTIAHPVSAASISGAAQYTDPQSDVTYLAADSQIVLSAADPQFAINVTSSITLWYRIDGGTAQIYTAPITLAGSGDGPHTVVYWFTDGAGNVEPRHTLTVALDTTPPVVTPVISGSFAPDGSVNGPVAVVLAVTDAGSGVADVKYSVDPPCIPGDQGTMACQLPYTAGQSIVLTETSTLNYAAIDRVGNTTAGSVAMTVSVPTPSPTALPTTTPTTTPTPTAPPTVTPTDPATATPTATRTPRSTPTWGPIVGPPPLDRQPLSRAMTGSPTAAAALALPVHRHVMPHRQSAHYGTRTKLTHKTVAHKQQAKPHKSSHARAVLKVIQRRGESTAMTH